MVILRPTRKLFSWLPPGPDLGGSDTALGDWYVNRIVVDRQPLLLLVSSRALLPMLLPARGVRDLPDRLPDLVATRLRRLQLPSQLIRAEVAAMTPVTIAKTADRSVMGIMVDFAKAVPFHLVQGAWDATTLPFVESRLAETPCHAARRFEEVVFPDAKTPALLTARWHAG